MCSVSKGLSGQAGIQENEASQDIYRGCQWNEAETEFTSTQLYISKAL